MPPPPSDKELMNKIWVLKQVRSSGGPLLSYSCWFVLIPSQWRMSKKLVHTDIFYSFITPGFCRNNLWSRILSCIWRMVQLTLETSLWKATTGGPLFNNEDNNSHELAPVTSSFLFLSWQWWYAVPERIIPSLIFKDFYSRLLSSHVAVNSSSHVSFCAAMVITLDSQDIFRLGVTDMYEIFVYQLSLTCVNLGEFIYIFSQSYCEYLKCKVKTGSAVVYSSDLQVWFRDFSHRSSSWFLTSRRPFATW